MGTMAVLVQMWVARFQSRPSRQPPFTETTFLFCGKVDEFRRVNDGGGELVLVWCVTTEFRSFYKSS